METSNETAVARQYPTRLHFTSRLSEKVALATRITGFVALSFSVITATMFIMWVAALVNPEGGTFYSICSALFGFGFSCIADVFYFVGVFSGSSGYYETIRARHFQGDTEDPHNSWFNPEGIMFLVWYHIDNKIMLGTGLFMVMTSVGGFMSFEHPSAPIGWVPTILLDILVAVIIEFAAVTFIIKSEHMHEHAAKWGNHLGFRTIRETEDNPIVIAADEPVETIRNTTRKALR